MWLGGFAFFYSIWLVAGASDHPSNKPSVSIRMTSASRRWLSRVPLHCAGPSRSSGEHKDNCTWWGAEVLARSTGLIVGVTTTEQHYSGQPQAPEHLESSVLVRNDWSAARKLKTTGG